MSSKLISQEDIFNLICNKSDMDLYTKELISNSKAELKDVLKLYQNAYQARKTEALCETYPSVWRFLGDEKFFDLCNLYILKNTSKFYDIGEYGKLMPDFIQNLSSDSLSLDHSDFLFNLAKFEWIYLECFHEKIFLKQNFLEQSDWMAFFDQALKIQTPQRIKLLELEYDVYGAFKLQDTEIENIKDLDLKSLNQSLDTPNASYYLMYRPNKRVNIQKISEIEFKLLLGLKKPMRFDELSDFIEELLNTRTQAFKSLQSKEEIIQKLFLFLSQIPFRA